MPQKNVLDEYIFIDGKMGYTDRKDFTLECPLKLQEPLIVAALVRQPKAVGPAQMWANPVSELAFRPVD